MAIEYAILGLLSWRPFSGYELRKFFSESVALYWSGNNNQVYPTLVRLHKEGLVENEVRQRGNYPPSKVYSLTPAGEEALTGWVTADPAVSQIRSTFLTQLAWADRLTSEELDSLLNHYQHELQLKLLMQRELIRRKPAEPARTSREVLLWKMIADHDCALYEAEVDWLGRLRQALVKEE